jgi:flagellar motor protein MotB
MQAQSAEEIKFNQKMWREKHYAHYFNLLMFMTSMFVLNFTVFSPIVNQMTVNPTEALPVVLTVKKDVPPDIKTFLSEMDRVFTTTTALTDFDVKEESEHADIRFGCADMFGPGMAEFINRQGDELARMAEILTKYKDHIQVTVESYTDDVPVRHSPLYKNNWELSAARATQIIDIFVKAGFTADQLALHAYAEGHLLYPRPVRDVASAAAVTDGSANENEEYIKGVGLKNRRIVIRVESWLKSH